MILFDSQTKTVPRARRGLSPASFGSLLRCAHGRVVFWAPWRAP